jgi:hypothetical protein
MPSTSSCTPQEPFIKLDPSGQASILDYSLPQETCFEVKGYIDIKVNADCWKPTASLVPDLNFWDETKDYSASQILELINEDVLGSSAKPLFLNSGAIQRLSLVENSSAKMASSGRSKNAQLQDVAKDGDDYLIAGVSANQVVGQILKARRPLIRPNLYGRPVLTFIPRPKTPKPTLTLVLHYKVCTFAGDYGAGKTVKTFSLLPGERTTITVTSYKHNEETKHRAESVLDSFSESSAQEFQNTIETQTGRDMTAESSETKSKELGGGVNLSAVGIPVDVSGGVSNGSTTSSSVSEHVSAINSAMDTHSSLASHNRDVSVNTEVGSTAITEQTESTTRELRNINLSRVLNFVFRQLLQEYVTITYLDDVSIVFSNGYPESRKVVKLSNINDLLAEVLKDGAPGSACDSIIEKTRKGIFKQLCNFFDYQGDPVSFMECVTQTLNDCCGGTDAPITNTFARKIPSLSQTAEGHTVPGIIVNVKKRIMRTDSVVVDSLLGQGEALDCYNQKLQDIAVEKAQLDNDAETQRQGLMQTLIGNDPAIAADKYKKVFGPCCDTPQSCCCGNCGDTVATTR